MSSEPSTEGIALTVAADQLREFSLTLWANITRHSLRSTARFVWSERAWPCGSWNPAVQAFTTRSIDRWSNCSCKHASGGNAFLTGNNDRRPRPRASHQRLLDQQGRQARLLVAGDCRSRYRWNAANRPERHGPDNGQSPPGVLERTSEALGPHL